MVAKSPFQAGRARFEWHAEPQVVGTALEKVDVFLD